MYQRLNNLGICVSHNTTLRLLDKLGENFDAEVMEWKKKLEDTLVEQVIL